MHGHVMLPFNIVWSSVAIICFLGYLWGRNLEICGEVHPTNRQWSILSLVLGFVPDKSGLSHLYIGELIPETLWAVTKLGWFSLGTQTATPSAWVLSISHRYIRSWMAREWVRTSPPWNWTWECNHRASLIDGIMKQHVISQLVHGHFHLYIYIVIYIY